ncbi:uncharacterized protein LOC111343437 [Stylophora pistillata]|uniref:uncharacterized protein LOC111343437 n=1 Tax=Stylophora pistillata TaxID=50429 RepID=UPI000C04976E|nr:uncharacterized protein LOC111343437 [Stylophora pistillata]
MKLQEKEGDPLRVQQTDKIVSKICDRLLRKEWRPYELDRVPQLEGIYVIGQVTEISKFGIFGEPEVVYCGRSNDVHRRLGEHMRQNLRIDEFVKEEFKKNMGRDLRVKWIHERNDDRIEIKYIHCIADRLGYWPKYNIRR